MKLCVFSDIHGNMVFFDAFLNAIQGKSFDRLFFLGDSVSYYPDGAKVLQKLREINAYCLEGNHDSMLRGEFPIPENHEPAYQLRKTMEEVSPDTLEYVKSWPEIHYEIIDDRRLVFVHGSPLNHLKGYSYEDSELAKYDNPDEDVVFVGHTHRPWIRQNPHTLMVNVGSIGLPRDADHGCSPSWAVYDTKTGEAQLHRVSVDPNLVLQTYGDRIHSSVRECLFR